MDRYNGSIRDILNASLWSTLYYTNKNGKKRPTIRAWRWLSILVINVAFFLSFFIDMQLLEGTLNGSRLLGFHLIDPFTGLEIWAAEHHIHTNVIIGTATLIAFYFLFGGKAYCSWVCPYGLLSEIGEYYHLKLIRKRIIKEHKFDPRYRFVFWIVFLIMAAVDGYLVFEMINPIGIISRIITYGWSVAIVWVFLILAFEIFYARRAWCTYVCPVGTTYNLLGWISMTKPKWDMNMCDHCGACLVACPEDHVLEFIKPKYDKKRKEKRVNTQLVVNGDCTLCGRCMDVCHTDAYHYDFRLKDLI